VGTRGGASKLYKEGDWFLVPIDRARSLWAVGLIARAGRRGVLASYFFGPAVETAPGPEQLAQLAPKDSVYASQFGDLGLVEWGWPIIWSTPEWERVRDRWSLNVFSHFDIMSGEPRLRIYDENDPDRLFAKEIPCSVEEALRYPEDGLAGSGFIEQRLRGVLLEGYTRRQAPPLPDEA
jgi:hypothetical protein